tara:strand:+ start:210 stop:356 length:147 start_codon:yes stop_codon:yes gene_type:complete
MQFDLMHLPDEVPIAVPIENDGQIDSRTLLVMRDTAWSVLQEWEKQDA